jgi:hypothetical protein
MTIKRSAQQGQNTRSGRHIRQSTALPADSGTGHDLTGAGALLPQIAAEVLIADKAYDADEISDEG